MGKAFVPLMHFEAMIKDTAFVDVGIIIEPGKVIVGKFTSVSNRITIHNTENIETIQLAINPTQLELLALRFQYSYEELLTSNYDAIVRVAEEKLEQNVTKAANLLREYEITPEIIKEIIKLKIDKRKI